MAFTLKQIGELVGGEVNGDAGRLITGISSLADASPGDISFYADPRYKDSLKGTKASALLVSRKTDLYPGAQILVKNPALAYARVAALFAPALPRHPGVSPRAVIQESSVIGEETSIYPLVYVGRDAVIGNGVTLFPGVYVGDRVKIGDRTVLYPNVVVLADCIVGNDVILHAGTVVGSDGFGFVQDRGTSVKIPQLGIVQIDDQVEIGANSTIDRAALGRTWIQKGVKTDNLVQIAHNAVIGEGSIVVAQAAIAGSARLGHHVIVGGQVAINDHVEIGDRVMIGSQSGVAKSIPAGEVVSGTPTMPHRLWLRISGLITRLPEFLDRLKRLEKG
ncbi:MAG: UDP-3-O-(3-hydroxymyristoyl)glucosamine N-acyltransferase, partial [Deltaproteobacteria bacterium]|nr:UDP-3-O-(3-hydroxymyristoyl)glucosamine N-acyltransferase [Deltaproteobacteria bacterium]